ncbi:tautomerase family protein [bacterium]|nr:tautomerase family protein [bacterium]
MEETAGKSKKYVMIDISCGENLFFGGNKGNCTFCDIRLLGELSKKQKNEITSQITCLVTEITDISADRIYVTFAEYDRDNWGWNSKTFGE